MSLLIRLKSLAIFTKTYNFLFLRTTKSYNCKASFYFLLDIDWYQIFQQIYLYSNCIRSSLFILLSIA